ncbi:hypothetical protein BHM03_00035664 [Ensete ventricosum]|nr:hypothetical protein BHM03_00035664 [Ensete ventricosum]
MRSANYASALVCAMALAMACTTLAQNSPQDFVDAHNSARAAVGVGSVSWDNNVAAYAQKYANQRIGDCQLVHSGGPYGENLFWGSGADFTAADAINSWVGEKQYYDYDSNSFTNGRVCGHYTQGLALSIAYAFMCGLIPSTAPLRAHDQAMVVDPSPSLFT